MEGCISSPQNTRVAVVTGGNKGFGLEVCRQLASNGVTVILTVRDEARGAEAVGILQALGLSNVLFHQLDITDASSIARLPRFLENRFGKLDILVNNAAIGGVEYLQELDNNEEKLMGLDFNQRLEWLGTNVRDTNDAAMDSVQTNYYGTKHVTQALLPLLHSSSQGRIVNVSSFLALLSIFRSEEMKHELNDIDNLTERRIDELLDRFLKDFEAGELELNGWPAPGYMAYKFTKAAMNAYSRILARRHPGLRVNCVSPGYVRPPST